MKNHHACGLWPWLDRTEQIENTPMCLEDFMTGCCFFLKQCNVFWFFFMQAFIVCVWGTAMAKCACLVLVGRMLGSLLYIGECLACLHMFMFVCEAIWVLCTVKKVTMVVAFESAALLATAWSNDPVVKTMAVNHAVARISTQKKIKRSYLNFKFNMHDIWHLFCISVFFLWEIANMKSYSKVRWWTMRSRLGLQWNMLDSDLHSQWCCKQWNPFSTCLFRGNMRFAVMCLQVIGCEVVKWFWEKNGIHQLQSFMFFS